jgi:hypothetical protein
MIGRIFDALSRRRRLISLPPSEWKAAFAQALPLYPQVRQAPLIVAYRRGGKGANATKVSCRSADDMGCYRSEQGAKPDP